MLNENPKCSLCNEEIEGEELVFMKMRYPKRKGFTGIKDYLKNEGRFMYERCFDTK